MAGGYIVGGARARRAVALGMAGLALSALALALAALSATAVQARASDTPVQQAVTLDSPAVVRIVSVIQARLTCAGCATDGSDVVSPAPASSPFTYYSSGSGAFISPDGAILTADHVVDHSMDNPDDVGFVEQQAAQDISQRFNVTSDQALQILQNSSHVTISFTVTFQRAYLSTSYTGALRDTSHIYAFDVASIVASSPVDKQDTAIVRINTSGITPAPDFPYLTLASEHVQALDTVTAIAFPADADLALNSADFTALVSPAASDANTITSLLSPSVNSGSVTNANEVRSDGTPVYEANGIGSNGSSGGPVVNDQGKVIGFVDAGPATNRLTFITPSTVVAPYATRAGVANLPQGRFMGLWSKTLTDYYATGSCHWTSASSDFTTLSTQYPQFGGAKDLASTAKLKAAGESCSTGGASTVGGSSGAALAGFAIIGGCLLAVLALIAGVIFLVFALVRRRRPVPAPVAPPALVPPQPPHGYVVPGYPPAQPFQAPQPAYPPVSGPPPGYPPVQPYQAPRGYPPVQSGPYAPGGEATALRQPGPSAPMTPGQTRFCPNGHAVLEADAAFCPVCGAPMSPGPQS
jgi:S1-C subfamily serine protease